MHSDYDAVARHYGTEILSSLMGLYLQSEQKIDLSQLLQGIEFNPESDADLDSLVARFELLNVRDIPISNDWYPHTDWLRTHINNIDLNVVKRLLFDQIILSEGIAPEEDLSYAMDLLEGHDAAIDLNKNYEAILAQAIADVEAWDGEVEQQLLDELWTKIEIMHQTGGSVVGVPVGHIIGAFERYHKHMTAHQVTMAYWSEMKDQLAYLHMSDDEKREFHKQQKAHEYLDDYGIDYDPYATSEHLINLILDDLRAHPDRTVFWLSSGFNLYSESLFANTDDPSLIAQQEALMAAFNRNAELLLTQDQREFIAGVALFLAGFIPLVGTAMDVLDFVTSLARGDVIGASLNLIPMIGDVVSGLRRVAGRGRRIYSSAKLIEPEIDDVTDTIDKVEDVARKIDEKKRVLAEIRSRGRTSPPRLARDEAINLDTETPEEIFSYMHQGQLGFVVPGEGVEYALVRVRDVSMDSLHPRFGYFEMNRGRFILIKAGPTGFDLDDIVLDDGQLPFDILVGHSHPVVPDHMLPDGRKYYQPSGHEQDAKFGDIPTLRDLAQESSYIITGDLGKIEIYRFDINDKTIDIESVGSWDEILLNLNLLNK